MDHIIKIKVKNHFLLLVIQDVNQNIVQEHFCNVTNIQALLNSHFWLVGRFWYISCYCGIAVIIYFLKTVTLSLSWWLCFIVFIKHTYFSWWCHHVSVSWRRSLPEQKVWLIIKLYMSSSHTTRVVQVVSKFDLLCILVAMAITG